MAIKYPKGRVRRYAVHRKFRNVVMSTRYKDAPYTVGCMLRSSPFKHPTVEHMCKILKREVHHLCGMKCGKSILRDLTPKRLSNFSWTIVCKEIKKTMPLPCIKCAACYKQISTKTSLWFRNFLICDIKAP